MRATVALALPCHRFVILHSARRSLPQFTKWDFRIADFGSNATVGPFILFRSRVSHVVTTRDVLETFADAPEIVNMHG